MNPSPFSLLRYILALLFVANSVEASSIIPLNTADHVGASAAVFRGVVVGQDCFRDASDNQIYTRTSLRVIEALKGTFPTIVAVVHRGGAIGEERDFSGHSPLFAQSDECLMFVVRRSDGKLTGTQGIFSAVRLVRTNGVLSVQQESLLNDVRNLTANGSQSSENVSDQNGFVSSSLVTGLLADGAGISSRFLQPDRGEPIPVLIDADSLPTGITVAQATNAVLQALNAWAVVTKLKFTVESIQGFGAGADTITGADEKLRIQLHDNYNRINSVGTLGVGGRFSLSSPLSGSGWDLGGAVKTNEFYKTSRGYVVLEHGEPTMQNLLSFTEVLCHEIGHALSMAHSSTTFPETNSTLYQSIMYFQVHADGRGATLGAYDPPIIQQAYPSNNTPPYTYSRVMDVTTAAVTPNVTGINDVELRGYDLQTSALILLTNNAANLNGEFTKTAYILKYTPGAFYSTSVRIDPASGSYNDRICYRFSDGTNSSPYSTLRVVSFNTDNFPAGASDGIPDNWMIANWGSANPASGTNRSANADFDGDKITNLNEYRAGMSPIDTNSAQRITLINKTNIQFQAKAYELYELQASTNMTNWVRALNPILPTTSTGSFTGFTNNSPKMFFRVEKVR